MCMWEGGRGSQAGGKVDGQPAKRSGCLEGVKSERASVGEEGYVLLLLWRVPNESQSVVGGENARWEGVSIKCKQEIEAQEIKVDV